jgi:hypothetical protein
MSLPTAGHAIVDTAIQLLMELPHAPALALLDRAMKAHAGSAPPWVHFDAPGQRRPHPCYASALRPPSPFAELVRRAFAPQMDPRELLLLSLSDRTDDSALQQRIRLLETRWQQVLDKFSVYYHLSVQAPLVRPIAQAALQPER